MKEDKTITMEVITFLKYKDECYEIGELIKNLLDRLEEKDKEIERLKEKINEYENPDDMALMYIWCNEKAKEEIERLNSIINELLKYIEEKADENDDNTMISKSFKFALYDIVGKLQELIGSNKENINDN